MPGSLNLQNIFFNLFHFDDYPKTDAGLVIYPSIHIHVYSSTVYTDVCCENCVKIFKPH